MKRFLFTLCALLCIMPFSIAKAESVNWAKALQLSLYFYDANKCGPGVAGGRLEWRGDCHIEDASTPLTTDNTNLSASFITTYQDILDPDGDGLIDVSGGFHDAGDHVKFGLPQSYSASTLGWGLYEFKDAYVQSGNYEHIIDHLKWFSDYFLRCTFMNANNEVIAFAYMVGAGGVDHTYWGPPELQLVSNCPRPVTFATEETPGSDQAAGAAAALALMYLNYYEIDNDYAEQCLTAAKALYEFAKEYRGLGNGDGFYGSGYDEDELSWAGVWLYIATGEYDYIEQIISYDDDGLYTGWIKKIISTRENTWQNIWTHCWDVVWGGVFVKLAEIIEDDSQYEYFARWNIEYWSGGSVPHEDPADGNYLEPTPAGYAMINTWGSARYNTAAQLCALVYNKSHNRSDIAAWCKGQMEYLFGDNPMDRCYEVGYAENSATHPHHRAAHGSQTNSMVDPEEHRHTLWGALVGGPDADDIHVDDTTDYVYNEVAIDYNAGFAGALAGLYTLYGEGTEPEPDFPPLEGDIKEYFVEAKIEQENQERSQITIAIHSESVHPPHFCNDMSARYYFDISELVENGQTIDDVSITVYYDEMETLHGASVKITGPTAWNLEDDNNIYYYQFDWQGADIYGDLEMQFGIITAQDMNWESHWDPTNDWSHKGLTETMAETTYIPFFIDGEQVFGNNAPEGNVTIPPTVSITAPEDGSSFYEGSDITITANATDNEEVVSVEFFANDEKIGEATSAPYTINWENVSQGTYAITAVATDNTEVSTTSEVINVSVTIMGNIPPTAEILYPESGDQFTEGETITISAEAGDEDGEVTKVEFYSDDDKIGELTEAPYNFDWENIPAGQYNLTVVATDDLGTTTRSDAVSIVVKAEGTEDIDVTYSIDNEWDDGSSHYFQAIILIENNGSQAVTWTASWTFPGDQLITTDTWNGTFIQSGNSVTVTGSADWNKTLQPGQSVEVGCIIEGKSCDLSNSILVTIE